MYGKSLSQWHYFFALNEKAHNSLVGKARWCDVLQQSNFYALQGIEVPVCVPSVTVQLCQSDEHVERERGSKIIMQLAFVWLIILTIHLLSIYEAEQLLKWHTVASMAGRAQKVFQKQQNILASQEGSCEPSPPDKKWHWPWGINIFCACCRVLK